MRYLAALTLLALVACGGGKQKAVPKATAEITPGTLSVGAESPAPGGSPASSPGTTPKSGSPKPTPARTPLPSPRPIPAEAAKAVTLLLDAIEREDYPTQRHVTFDALRALVTIRDIISQENARRGAKTDNTVEVAEEPKLIDQSNDTARVSLRATNKAVVSGEKGTLPETTELTGPVSLKKVEGEWRVVDLVYGGSPLVPGYHLVDKRSTQNEFEFRVGVIQSYKETTATLIRFVFQGKGQSVPIKIKQAWLVAPDGTEQKWTQFAFESRTTPVGFFGFKKIDGKPRSIRVDVEREDTHVSWTYDVAF